MVQLIIDKLKNFEIMTDVMPVYVYEWARLKKAIYFDYNWNYEFKSGITASIYKTYKDKMIYEKLNKPNADKDNFVFENSDKLVDKSYGEVDGIMAKDKKLDNDTRRKIRRFNEMYGKGIKIIENNIDLFMTEWDKLRYQWFDRQLNLGKISQYKVMRLKRSTETNLMLSFKNLKGAYYRVYQYNDETFGVSLDYEEDGMTYGIEQKTAYKLKYESEWIYNYVIEHLNTPFTNQGDLDIHNKNDGVANFKLKFLYAITPYISKPKTKEKGNIMEWFN